jgi:alcohol dehydrogenase
MKSMRAIVNTAPGRLEMRELPLPEPGPGQVRVRTLACGICATDLRMIAGWDRTGFPSVPGHEWSGEVDAVGPGVGARLIGARCVAENVLADGGEVGFEHPGGYGEHLITEAAKVRRLPDGLSPAAAALIEPLAVCVRGLRRLRPAKNCTALVFGDGPIGLLLLLLLRRAGARRLVLVGGRARRLALARSLGADAVVDYHAAGGSLAEAVAEAAAGQPLSAVAEASGSTAVIAAALAIAAPASRVLIMGDYGLGRADFAWEDLLHREFELIGSNASAGAWPEAVRLAGSGEVPLERLVTHRLGAERFAEAMELARSRDSGAIKVVLEWRE